MATGTILLDIGSAMLPDGSSNNAAPALQRVKSSAAAPTPYFLQAAFDASTNEILMWSFRMPSDYASGPVLKVKYKMFSATSGGVAFSCYIMAVTAGDSQDVDANDFATVNTGTDAAVPGTAGYLDVVSITLTNADSLAPGDFVVLRLNREVGDAADTATGDAEVVAVAMEYTVA
jgi:hypothetical protein